MRGIAVNAAKPFSVLNAQLEFRHWLAPASFAQKYRAARPAMRLHASGVNKPITFQILYACNVHRFVQPALIRITVQNAFPRHHRNIFLTSANAYPVIFRIVQFVKNHTPALRARTISF